MPLSVGFAENSNAIDKEKETEGPEFIEENTRAFLTGLGQAFVSKFERQHMSSSSASDTIKEDFMEYLRKTVDNVVEEVSKKFHSQKEPLPRRLDKYLFLVREAFYEAIQTKYQDLAAYHRKLESSDNAFQSCYPGANLIN